jgi:hypothetical protein
MARRAGSPPVFGSTHAWRRCGSGSRARRTFGYGAGYQSVGKRLETLATSAMKKDREGTEVWAEGRLDDRDPPAPEVRAWGTACYDL